MNRSSRWFAVCVLLIACRERRTQAERGHAMADTTSPSRSGCPAHLADARIDTDSIAGLSTRATIAALRSQCSSARIDTVGVGGTTAAALRFDAPGVTIWAIQTAHDAYDDSLHGS